MSETQKLLTSAQVAQLLGLSTKTVQIYAEIGRIAAIKVGRDWLFTYADIMAYKSTKRKAGRPTGKKFKNRTSEIQKGK